MERHLSPTLCGNRVKWRALKFQLNLNSRRGSKRFFKNREIGILSQF